MVEATSRGVSGGEGTRHRPSATGVRFMLRSGGTLDGLFGLACCPLCGREGVPLDLRHVLSGECSEGVTVGGARRAPDRRLRTAVQQRRPGRVPRFVGAYSPPVHRAFVSGCEGSRHRGIA